MDVIKRLFVDSYNKYKPDTMNEFFYKETFNSKAEIVGNRFMSRNILGSIISKRYCKIEKQYIFDNTRVCLVIFCTNKNFPFVELYRVLNFYITVLNKLRHIPVVNIMLYATNLKKQFPSTPGIVLDENNVNSGVTIFQSDDYNERMIVIYRKEELFKVLLHELIHYYELDFHDYNGMHDTYFIEKYGVVVSEPYKNRRNPLALYESYTETVACYGYVLTYMLFKNKPMEQKNIQSLVEKETKHYMIQAHKVFKYGHMRENTHVFSYYIIKAAIYFQFDKFKDFLKANGIKMDALEKQERYLDFIKAMVGDAGFWKELKRTHTTQILLSTLKMTKLAW